MQQKAEHPLVVYTVRDLHIASQSIAESIIEECEHLADIRHQIVYEGGTLSLVKITGTSLARVNFMQSKEEKENDSIENLIKEHFALDNIRTVPRWPKTDPEKHNRNTVLSWLRNLEKKLKRDEELKQKYVQKIRHLFENGYAEKACELPTPRMHLVMEEQDMKLESRVFESNSRTVLTWIRTGARVCNPFVAYWIAELEENTKKAEWRWIPTKENVVDDVTRDAPSVLYHEQR
ncbi:hypothetical protein EVAR_33510_1 [Eumeta japonica]|uniref:Uncharacterized protein n=1 Tax=Eumeta variegata TaxID=151549 RepID=A0A4C1VK36_EUMVA|nr:hypothetical protein EVAR_33510_1 [Eumeta japonica]